MKMKFKISVDQTNIDKYRLAANITYYIKIKLVKNFYSKIYDDKAFISCTNFTVERNKFG